MVHGNEPSINQGIVDAIKEHPYLDALRKTQVRERVFQAGVQAVIENALEDINAQDISDQATG
jgi:hypothetical protein